MDDEALVGERWIDPVMGFQVTLYDVAGAIVETDDGRHLWWTHGGQVEGGRGYVSAREAVSRELGRFERATRVPVLQVIDEIAAPVPMERLTVDRRGRWAAIGGGDDAGWVASSLWPDPLPIQLGVSPAVHWLDDEVVVVTGGYRDVVAIDRTGRVDTIFSVERYVRASCTTDSLVVLASSYGQDSLVAIDRDGERVFDHVRDLTEPMDGGRLILAGRPVDTAEQLAQVDGDRLFWVDGEDVGYGETIDLRTREVTAVDLPAMFDSHSVALAADGTVVARVIPTEIWTVSGDGPIERWAVPELWMADPVGGGRMLLWDADSTTAVVFDPATAGGS